VLAHGPAAGGPARRSPRLEVADIVRLHGEAFAQRHALSPEQRKVLHDIAVCRTAALGGHLDVCDVCGFERPSYNSCRNRHCPKCQSLAQAKWITTRKERLLPTKYFHVVFTLPAHLRPVALASRERVFNLLFEAASATLLAFGQSKRLGARLGITAVLHTWTRELAFHPHMHCIVTGGGLTEDGERWVDASDKYLFPVKALSRVFRGKFLDALAHADARGELDAGGEEGLARLRDRAYRKDWVVYAKAPFGGPAHLVEYLGRYTHRVGISNHRLLSLTPQGVHFATKQGKTTTLSPDEFLRRFIMHVLPKGFVKIRHYGLFAAGNISTRLETARRLLQARDAAPEVAHEDAAPAVSEMPGDVREHMRALTGVDIALCSRCQAPMRRVALPDPAAAPRVPALKDTS
jgi:predicted Zn-ribbon and HTH transcriptional regulator